MKKYFLYFLGLNLIAFAVVLNVRFVSGGMCYHRFRNGHRQE